MKAISNTVAHNPTSLKLPRLISKGPVFRVSPNELSFASLKSWKDIYGHAVGKKQTLIKSQFYDMYGAGFRSLCIGSERDPQKHRRMKQSLTAAFSTKALREQEEIVANVVDAFVDKIGTLGGPQSDGLDMTEWYEMLAFDILGEMAFGESFGCIEDGRPYSYTLCKIAVLTLKQASLTSGKSSF